MIIVIPLNSDEKIFKKAGYNYPVPLINVMGKPILYWLIDSLNSKEIDFIYIPYNKELFQYRFEDRIKHDYPHINFRFFVLQNDTMEEAETILSSLNNLDNKDCDILCLSYDKFYTTDITLRMTENCVYIFDDNIISNCAYFNSWKILQKYCKIIINKNKFYISDIIQEMINDNIKFNLNKIKEEDYICLKTPLDIRLFCNNFPVVDFYTNKTTQKQKRYCFDLDNTLVTYPKIANDYTSVEPIENTIRYVRYLKKLGHIIIIHTARRMKTHSGNTGKVLQNIGKITFDTLEKFNIPYDEIYFGKPYADYYIDDLAISAFSDLEKELGYYTSNIEPRSFNSLTESVIIKYRKESDNLDGEIYYYQNIPRDIKDLFPFLINYDINNKWYDIEKINSIPISKLYLSKQLTTVHIDNIFNSIVRIHNCITDVDKQIDIYHNYSEKIKNRYNNYDYSKYENSKNIFTDLVTQLNEYQSKNKGITKMIHGDPVFTNILINKLGKLKFIDMRGKQGDVLTIYGDWLYDWSKIFQSLIGYDEILENTKLDTEYKNIMINHFKKLFITKYSQDDFNNLKLITKSLLFSLIPLHDNEKCKDYYMLIQMVDNY